MILNTYKISKRDSPSYIPRSKRLVPAVWAIQAPLFILLSRVGGSVGIH